MEKKVQRINFYRLKDPYGEFSNYYVSPFTLQGKEWKTTEHYFQAQKHIGTEFEEVIRKAEQPGEAKNLARGKPYARTDWEEVKVNIMYECCKAKFSTNDHLRKLLLSTGDAYLSEHTKNDSYWGDGGDDTGLNQLGKVLMKVRDELKAGK